MFRRDGRLRLDSKDRVSAYSSQVVLKGLVVEAAGVSDMQEGDSGA